MKDLRVEAKKDLGTGRCGLGGDAKWRTNYFILIWPRFESYVLRQVNTGSARDEISKRVQSLEQRVTQPQIYDRSLGFVFHSTFSPLSFRLHSHEIMMISLSPSQILSHLTFDRKERKNPLPSRQWLLFCCSFLSGFGFLFSPFIIWLSRSSVGTGL